MPCKLGDSALIVTPGRASLWLSATWPEIVPVVVCAVATAATARNAAANSHVSRTRIMSPPVAFISSLLVTGEHSTCQRATRIVDVSARKRLTDRDLEMSEREQCLRMDGNSIKGI